MNRKAEVYFHNKLAGNLKETDDGYRFEYVKEYTDNKNAKALSKTLNLSTLPYDSKVIFSFFDGLIPEGWLLNIAFENWKINTRDRFGLLSACCQNTIGAVSVRELKNEKL